MKKSSPHLLSTYNHLRSGSISLLIILILFYSASVQAQTSNPFLKQNQFDPRTDFPLVFSEGQAIPRQAATATHHVWETIQTITVNQPNPNSGLPPTKFNLDQIRNGRGSAPEDPAGWVNGNAGASNAHFIEGWSIPYRVSITDLAIGTHSLDIEWDIKHSGANAIDFVTNYDLIDYPSTSHLFNFGHGQETISPLPETGSWASGSSSVIPAPSLPAGAVTTYRNQVMAYSNASGDANKFSIWNGTINSMVLLSEGSLGAQQSATRMRIIFTNTEEDVIIAWGGHIAKGEGVWGAGSSAGAISGSPYHTRLISWDPDGDGNNQTSIGNQDRSLSAAAVQDPPICNLNGPSSLECSATSSFTSGVAQSDLSQGVTFDWEIEGATNCGTITLSNESVGSASVTTSSSCGCSFSLVYIILKNNEEISRCVKLITVTDAQAPGFTSTPSGSDLGCNPTGLPTPVNPSATDNCGTPTVTSSDGSISSNSCSRSQTRIYTATDACGNTATVGQTFTWVADVTPPVFTACQPDVIVECGSPTSTAALGSATATDGCGSTTVTANDATPLQVGCQTVIVRTWTARDACGNTATCAQRIAVTDNTPPTIICNANGSATASDACGSYYLYQNGTTWTAIDASGNIRTASCIPQVGRVANLQVMEEQQVQQQINLTGEKTVAPKSPKELVKNINVQAYPNPFSDRVKFLVTSSEGGNGSLEIYNMTGQKIKTFYTGFIAAGTQTFELSLPIQQVSNLLYVLRVGDKKVTGKILQMNR